MLLNVTPVAANAATAAGGTAKGSAPVHIPAAPNMPTASETVSHKPDPDWDRAPAPAAEAKVPPALSFEAPEHLADGDASEVADGEGRVSEATATTPLTAPVPAGDTTENASTYAMPGDTLQLQSTSMPQNKKVGNRWQKLSGTLAARADGRLAPESPLVDVSFAKSSSTTATASLALSAGSFDVSYVGTKNVAAAVNGASATYANAFANGATLVQGATKDGFEESVVIPNRAAGNAYDVTISMPANVTARQVERGIEFVDGSGNVVGTYGGAAAWDALNNGDAPVKITLTPSTSGTTTTAHVAVLASWFNDAKRKFPVTIDPAWSKTFKTSNALGEDTYVDYFAAGASHWTSPELVVGNGGGSIGRALMRFPLETLDQNKHVRVAKATMSVYTTGSGTCGTGAGTEMNVYALSAWNPQVEHTWMPPNMTRAQGQGPINWFGGNGGKGACAAGTRSVDVTETVKLWTGARIPNSGMAVIAANENSTAGWHKFMSSNNWRPPELKVDYDYYNAEYGDGRSWSRPAGTPFVIPVWVHNLGLNNWTSSQYELRAYAEVNGATTLVGTGSIPAGKSVKPGDWFQFPLQVKAMAAGQTALQMTMSDKTIGLGGGDFWYYGVNQRADALDISPSSSFGTPPNTELDGGLINTETGNFHYETTGECQINGVTELA